MNVPCFFFFFFLGGGGGAEGVVAFMYTAIYMETLM